MAKTSNPIFANPMYGSDGGAYHGFNSNSGVATLDGVINKTAIALVSVMLVAVAAFFYVPESLMFPITIGAGIAAFVAAIMVASRPMIRFSHVAVYALIEGLFIGGISKAFEIMYPGIATQAIFATVVVAGVTLAAFKFGKIRVSEKFRKMVTIATISLAAIYFINLGLSFAGISTGIIEVGAGAGPLAIIISIVAVLLATFNLIIDFDSVQEMVARRAPEAEEWRASFGLMVTLIWLYVELLRVLSYFRN